MQLNIVFANILRSFPEEYNTDSRHKLQLGTPFTANCHTIVDLYLVFSASDSIIGQFISSFYPCSRRRMRRG